MSAAFLFPGQGSQFVGMGNDYLKAFPSVAHRFEQAADCSGIDLQRVVAKGPRSALIQTDVAQVAIYTLSVAIADLLTTHGVSPKVVMGHSLGQFSALVVAGAMSFEAGLSLVVARGRLMHEQNEAIDGSMLAVTGLSLEIIKQVIEGIGETWVANQNAPGQTILSGLRPALNEAQARIQARGGRVTWLDVAGPYHSPLFNHTAENFSQVIKGTLLCDAVVPLIANSNATPLTRADELRAELHGHMLLPVRWSDSMQCIARMDVRLLIEVGPGKVMRGLALRNVPDIRCLGTDTVRELEHVYTVLQEVAR